MELCLFRKDKLQKILQSDTLENLLNEEEMRLYAKLSSPHRKEEWLAGRMATKSLLNKWLRTQGSLQVPEIEVAVCNDVDGRPHMVYKGSESEIETLMKDIDISISHDGDYALSGLTMGNRIGVDISMIRPINTAMRSYFLTNEELLHNKSFLAEEDGPITCWTIKEAYLKALGKGFSAPPKSFELFIGSDKKATIQDPSQVGRVKSIYFKRTKDLIISAVVIQK